MGSILYRQAGMAGLLLSSVELSICLICACGKLASLGIGLDGGRGDCGGNGR